MDSAFLGLGSNIGDRKNNLQTALKKLAAHKAITIEKISSLYETEPVGLKDQPWFYNIVIEVQTDLSPRELHSINKNIEKEMQREQTVRWGPRNIDIDLLLYSDLIVDETDLKIPHPELFNRAFVMLPLSEISGSIILAGDRSLNEVMAELSNEVVIKLPDKVYI